MASPTVVDLVRDLSSTGFNVDKVRILRDILENTGMSNYSPADIARDRVLRASLLAQSRGVVK